MHKVQKSTTSELLILEFHIMLFKLGACAIAFLHSGEHRREPSILLRFTCSINSRNSYNGNISILMVAESISSQITSRDNNSNY